MEVTNPLEELKLTGPSPTPAVRPALSYSSEEAFDFLDFFKKGTAGRTVFDSKLVPFLTLDDLVKGSRACRQMNGMCHTYSVGEVLSRYAMDDVAQEHKLELGKLVMGFVSPKYNSYRLHRRLIHSEEGGTFGARLYHPSVLPDILLAMTAYFNRHAIDFDPGMDEFDWDANSDPGTPLLVSARYGKHDTPFSFMDVTVILRYLLMRESNQRLVLRKPSNGPRYWYNYLFGDPCFRSTKFLLIDTRLGNGTMKTFYFCEDEKVKMKLRAGKPGDA